MTTDQQALLRSILINPHDDAPRLIYADYLDETDAQRNCERCHGSGSSPDKQYSPCARCFGRGWFGNGNSHYADFIRIQIRLERLHPGYQLAALPCGHETPVASSATRLCETCHLWERQYQALGPMSGSHLGKQPWYLPQSEATFHPHESRPIGYDWEVRRGFVSHLFFGWDDYEKYAAGLFAQHPITSIKIHDAKPYEGAITQFAYSWLSSTIIDRPWHLRPALIARLSRTIGNSYSDEFWIAHITEADAYANLQQAIIAEGRHRAGLPPLT